MRRSAALLGALLAVGLLSPAAGSAVTVGAPLGLEANVSENCQWFVLFGPAPSCTMFGSDLGGAWTSQTPRGSWRITRARVRTGPFVGPMAFTVLRAFRSQAGSPPSGVICCTVPAESQVFTPAPNSVNTVAVDLPAFNTVEDIDGEPVEVVDYLGISVLDTGSSLPMHVATSSADPAVSASLSYVIPALRRGLQEIPGGTTGVVPLVNGEFERVSSGEPDSVPPEPVALVPPPPPANAFTFLPRVRQLPGGRARLGVNAPGPGLLRAVPARGAGAVTAGVSARGRKAPSRRAGKDKQGKGRGKKGKRKPRLLRPSSRRVAQAGKAYIVLRLTRVGKRRLAKRGRLVQRVKFVFTPDGGTAAARVRRVVFREQEAKRKKCKGKSKRCAKRRRR